MLKERIINLIKEQSNLSFDKFMNLSLSDKKDGYYRVKNPIGLHADFTTAPEISQVFGELVGLWLFDTWVKLGSPKKCYLVELGGGRGIFMSDILRATKKAEGFHDALHIEIIEINKELIELQKKELKEYSNISWKDDVDELNIDAPILVVSNEFFDALPVKQYFFKDNRWFELLLGLTEEDNMQLNFVETEALSLHSDITKIIMDSQKQCIYETSLVANSIFHYLATMISKNRGAMLTIDYGYKSPIYRNSIRGFKNHEVLSIFDIINEPGNLDFTYDVNFLELEMSVEGLDIDTYSLMSQKDFLENLGIHQRAEVLLNAIKDNNEKDSFKKRIEILISPNEMGERFKCMCVSSGVRDLAIFYKR